MKGPQQLAGAATGHGVGSRMCGRRAQAGILAVVSLAICLAGCQLPGVGAAATRTPAVAPTASATPADAVWQALHRPLHLPAISPGASCPAAAEHRVSPNFGLALGDGPVYPVAPWVHGTYAIDGAASTQGWYDLKVLWISSPEYPGPTLIRGEQIDGSNALRFGNDGQTALAELEMPAGSGSSSTGGWGSMASYTMPRAPGCYAYQVDGSSFSQVIVFKVVM